MPAAISATCPASSWPAKGAGGGTTHPAPNWKFDLAQDGSGVRSFQEAGQYLNWILIPLAIFGGVVLYRRRRFDFVIVLVPIIAAANVALAFGTRAIGLWPSLPSPCWPR